MAESKFEKDLEKLEQTVEALETGGLSLDESLKRFEEGIRLARRCEKALAEAEQKIEILTRNAKGELTAEPFGEDPAPDSDAEPVAEKTRAKPPSENREGERPREPGEETEERGLLF